MSSIKQVELTIEHAKTGVQFGEALDRLLKNRDFQTVFLDGYLREEAIRLVHLKADPGVYTPEAQADIDRQITAVGQLGGWLNHQRRVLEQNRKDLAQNLAELEELRREEAGETD